MPNSAYPAPAIETALASPEPTFTLAVEADVDVIFAYTLYEPSLITFTGKPKNLPFATEIEPFEPLAVLSLLMVIVPVPISTTLSMPAVSSLKPTNLNVEPPDFLSNFKVFTPALSLTDLTVAQVADSSSPVAVSASLLIISTSSTQTLKFILLLLPATPP